MFYLDIFQALNKAGVKYLVSGGVAVNLHGLPRTTQDLDLMIDLSIDNINKFWEVITELGYKPRLPITCKEFKNEQTRLIWEEKKNMIAFSFYHEIDQYKELDVFIRNRINFENSYKNAHIFTVQNTNIYVMSIDDLISLKRMSQRERDLVDIEGLLLIKKMEQKENI